MSVAISIVGLCKKYGQTVLFDNFNLKIKPGKIVAIFGSNGSGKTTLLNMLCGITEYDFGTIKIIPQSVVNISYIFQNYRDSLLPWMSAYENIAFPLKLRKIDTQEIRRRIDEMIELFELNIDLRSYPYQLSGGQQQILSFMRALISLPNLILIDEPFSALDYENNLMLRKYLQLYYVRYNPTIVIVTHNIEEAVHLANEVVVFRSCGLGIANIISNLNSHPRNLDFLCTKEFERVKENVLSIIRKQYEKTKIY